MRIDNMALNSISYGLYVLTSRADCTDNGCIINTAMQLTSSPLTIAVCVNKTNHTHDMIKRSKRFNLSPLTQGVGFDLFERFGFASGRERKKYDGFTGAARAENGLMYLTEGANALISAFVTDEVDMGTHTLFIAEVTEARVLSDESSVTYEYYHKHIKPKKEEKKSGYICKICGYVYEGDELPDDFICPLCKHPASDFEKL